MRNILSLKPIGFIRTIFLIVAVFGLAVIGFQCSDVQLSTLQQVSLFNSRGFPMRVYPPSDEPSYRRFVFIVDMSQSMVAGPCPFDADDGPHFWDDSVFKTYDPNKVGFVDQADFTDGRGFARDCYVDSSLPREAITTTPPEPMNTSPYFDYKTHLGLDDSGYRFTLVKKLLDSIKSQTELFKDRTKVMVIPVSGGRAGEMLEKKIPALHELLSASEEDLGKLENYVEKLHSENNYNVDLNSAIEFNRWHFPGVGLTRTMGTTVPAASFDEAYWAIRADMESIPTSLTFSSYEVIYISDGYINPTKDQAAKVMRIHPKCSACQNGKVGTTNAPGCDVEVCSELAEDMRKTWGDYEANSFESLEFKLSLLNSLPNYYGSGNFRIHFFRLQDADGKKSYQDKENLFDYVKQRFESKGKQVGLWEIKDSNLPFRLVPNVSEAEVFKVTHLFLLNPNVRVDKNGELKVDSDGDGLFDEDEIIAGTNPLLPRTDGACLDSLATSEAFSERCAALSGLSDCDVGLDSDGDSLNECEERMLGTDTFDFDSDGDAIPDFLEIVYGLNALQPDYDIDTNGDGFPNHIHFASGVSPNVDFNLVSRENIMSYNVNYQGEDTFEDPLYGLVQVDKNKVTLKNAVLRALLPVPAANNRPLRSVRNTSHGDTTIPLGHRLINNLEQANTNRIMVLARVINPSNPQTIFWRILKFNVHVNTQQSEMSDQIDLSSMEQMQAIDRGEWISADK